LRVSCRDGRTHRYGKAGAARSPRDRLRFVRIASAAHREIRSLMDRMLNDALDLGLLRTDDVRVFPLAARALVYGLARTNIDGHLAQ
jgi:hypothetical protein